ncbi:MAG: T9SS type A sorting domain-containing protein [Sphingobacteriaceae bacterium]
MKTVLPGIFFMLLCASLSTKAQTTDRPTISSGGDYVMYSADVNFQSTLGEVLIQTIQAAGMILTQGFQQPEQIVNIPIGGGGIPADVLIYPNPAVDMVKIRFNLDAPARISFVLINNAGQVMHRSEQSFSAGVQEVPFDFKVAPGLYLLTLRFDGKTITTKVIVE